MSGLQNRWPPPPRSFVPSVSPPTSSSSGMNPLRPSTTTPQEKPQNTPVVTEFLSELSPRATEVKEVEIENPFTASNIGERFGDVVVIPKGEPERVVAAPGGEPSASASSDTTREAPVAARASTPQAVHDPSLLVGKDKFWHCVKSWTSPSIYSTGACGLLFGFLLAVFTVGLFIPPRAEGVGNNGGTLVPTPSGSLRGCCSFTVQYNYSEDILRGWSYVPSDLWDTAKWGEPLGPSIWASLYPGCSLTNNKFQSPIALIDSEVDDNGALTLQRSYGNDGSSLRIAPRVKTRYPGWEVNVGETSAESKYTWTINGTVYTLAQLHFHAPAEHTLNGEMFDMEGHFLHVSPTGDNAVFAVLFRLNSERETPNPYLDLFWSSQFTPSPLSLRPSFNISGLINDVEPVLYTYTGSTTVPPCKSEVLWHVTVSNSGVNLAQIVDFRHRMQLLSSTAREVQPRNGRTVKKFTLNL